ncbi:energy transducer TonB [Soonwooa sp.]|uniref:energy transducer TonB n=1 Tax=Soonwooa sp. TaxID=1938592 RepID=UPI002620A505|nr:energy transducer TonB [Soonwooa sp.]
MENLLKELQKRSLGLDEVVFENRNKAYGAYQLRHDYSHNLSKAMFFGIGLFISVAALPFIINSFKTEQVADVLPPTGPTILRDVSQPEVVPPPPAATPQAQPTVKTVEHIVPTPTREVKHEKTLASKKDLDNAAIGLQTHEGPVSPTPYVPIVPPNIIPSHVPVTVPVPQVPIVKDVNEIPKKVDFEASFKGGLDAFRKAVGENVNTNAVDQTGVVSAVVTFIVERDGTISNVKAKGTDADFNKEAERAIKNIKTKWTPAKLDGEFVRSYFKIPISIQIE